MYIIMLVGLLCATGCGIDTLPPGDYMRWVEDPDNDLTMAKELDGYRFVLQYKPVPYIILQENSGTYPGSAAFWKRAAELDGMQYYTLAISSDKDQDILKAGIHDENEYYSRLEYFTAVMQDDILLVEGSDTLACVLYHYERNYNLSPKSNFLLGFEKGANATLDGERTLVFQDQVFGTGTIKLSIPEESIQNTPALTEAL